MKAAVVKWWYDKGYTIRQTALISEVTEDYVRKILSGKRAQSIAADNTNVTDGMRRRAKVIDMVMSLKGADLVEGSDKYNYVSLLSYMGFTLEELSYIFPYDTESFIHIAALRSGEAWKTFDSTVIGISDEDYKYVFIERANTYEEKIVEELGEQQTYDKAKREQRKAEKMANKLKRKQHVEQKG